MKRKRIVSTFVVVLVIIEIISIFLVYKSGSNRKTILDNVKLNEIDKYSGIALMLQQSDGTYKESESSNWPTNGYMFNKELSGCIDGNGNTLENALTYKNGTLTIKTRTNASCYLYFDIPNLNSLCESYDDINKCSKREDLDQVNGIWDSTLEDDGYRYTGTNPDNYICFGTTNQSDCINEPDKYMYRIIGIFESEDGTQHLKLIKKEALNTTYEWAGNTSVDIEWNGSDLYNGLNGTYFVSNTEYSYMQDSNWYNKIETWSYTGTGTQTFYNGGPNYSSETVKNIYLHEMNRSGKTSTLGVWTTVLSKIGLMYVSDYALSLGSIALNYTSSINASTLKTGWMHLSNNDSGAPNSSEWTMTRSGGDSAEDEDSYYYAWNITSTGSISHGNGTDDYYSSRPVFYLKSGTKLTEGNGKESNPYIIGGTEEKDNLATTVIYNDTIEDDGLQQTIISGDDLYRFSGTSGNTGINNYICLGTDSCTSGDDNMYRIIGVNPNTHEVKVIKETPWNNGTTYAKNNNQSTISWDGSTLYTGTVSPIYDTLSFKDMIVTNHKWNIGSLGTTTYSTRTAMVTAENKTQTMANIGILSMTDYYLAYNGDRNWYSSYDITTNWIGGYLNGNTSAYEWTMSHTRTYYSYQIYYSSGRTYYTSNTGAKVIRPTVYLSSDVMYVKGDGTSANPYIVELRTDNTIKCSGTLGNCVIELDTASDIGLQQTLISGDELYRFAGIEGNFEINNYICLGNDECSSGDDNMYRIIGVNPNNGEVKVIKETPWNNGTTYAWHSNTSSTSWLTSALYTNTVSKIYDNLSFKNMIVENHKWNVGTLNTAPVTTRKGIIDYEKTTTGTASIGILSMTDYYLAYNGDLNWYSTTYANAKYNWIGGYLNKNSSGSEWTMTYYSTGSSSVSSWRVHNDSGTVGYSSVSYESAIRPTFYLKPEVMYVSGSGTSNDPFVVGESAANTIISNAGDDLWKSTLEEDGYRYVGTNPDNYVCFGYSEAETDCDFTNATNTDLYAYRIIGIFEDSNGTKHLKLIKKEALNTKYAWNADYSNDVNWENSDLYKGLNGEYFLNNTTYSYMQNSNWLNKIETWDYIATNTLTAESSGPDYFDNVIVQNIYLHEMNRSSKTSSIGVWETVNGKISLMYVSDYSLSLGSSALEYTLYPNRTTLKTGWMHISNNDSGAPNDYEWTSLRYGDYDGSYVWFMSSSGSVGFSGVNYTYSVRPVFYLTSDVTISGEGKINNPYIIN